MNRLFFITLSLIMLIIGFIIFIIIFKVLKNKRTSQDSYINSFLVYNNTLMIQDPIDTYYFNHKEGINFGRELKLNFEFTGVNTIWDIEVSENTLISIKYISNIAKGFFKVVLVGPKYEIMNILEGTDTGEKCINLNCGKGKIKLIGEDVKGDLNLSINALPNVTIIPFKRI